MDADRTPTPRGHPTERGSWYGSSVGEGEAHGYGTDRILTADPGSGRLDTRDALTGVLDPDPKGGPGVGPVAVPEASELFDQLVSRRRAAFAPTSTGTEHTDGTSARAMPRGRRQDRPRPDRRLRWFCAVALAALAVAVPVGVNGRAQLHRTETQLTEVRARLHQTVIRARSAAAALTAVTAQATSAAQVLATETDQLASVQSQLASTEANVFANGVSINGLDTCLSGVEQALNQISLGDQHGAATTLDGVAGSCRAAAPSP